MKQSISSFRKRNVPPQVTKRHLSKYKNRVSVQLPPALHSAATMVFNCFNCGRLHIFWQQNGLAASYRLRLEKPFDEVLDALGSTQYRLLADMDYDMVVDNLADTDNPSTELNLSAFQERFLHFSKHIWLKDNFQQIVVAWENGWITEYLYEYGERPLP